MENSVVVAPYARVKQYLKREMARGRWTPGAQLPSEAELVAQFGLSRMTVNRALRELQAEGLIERSQGRGSFVSQLNRVSSRLTIRDLHEEILARGHQHHAEVHLAKEEFTTKSLAQRLGLRVGEPVFHTIMVHYENDVPLQCEDRFVNPACAPDYLKVDFAQTTPTHYLLQVAPLWEAEYAIEASTPTAKEAKLLRMKPDEPCLIINRQTSSRGIPITCVRLVHPGSRYQIEDRFSP
jgi:GntR family transcriptional regulator, histidine utilization repressor